MPLAGFRFNEYAASACNSPYSFRISKGGIGCFLACFDPNRRISVDILFLVWIAGVSGKSGTAALTAGLQDAAVAC